MRKLLIFEWLLFLYNFLISWITQINFNEESKTQQLMIFASGFLIFYLKYIIEGFRINTFLISGAFINLLVHGILFQELNLILIFSRSLSLLYLLSLIYFPVYNFPKPTGKHKVAYKTLSFSDTLIGQVSVFYPCTDSKGYEQNTWLAEKIYQRSIFQRVALKSKWTPFEWLFKIGFNFLYHVKFETGQQPGSLISNSLDCVIFSHGFTQHRNAYSTYCQELASQGYVVFSLQHTEKVYPWDSYNTKALNSGNSVETLSRYQTIRAADLSKRCEQVISLIKVLRNGNTSDNFFNLKPKSIHLIGHSFGGATVLKVAQEEKIDSVIGLDPWLFPFTKQDMQNKVEVRTLIVSRNIFIKNEEVFQPSLLQEFLKHNPSINHYQIKILDHAYPADLTYLISGEMVIIKELRNVNNLFVINNLLMNLSTKFLKSLSFSSEEKGYLI